ncbi:hypothetical protein J3U91_00062 [Oenococcus oeni]|nr:hypothetical protein AC229_0692 [Oenococcus oeni]UCU85973.1 hypothetical protein J3U91_00062 [Oenococcus oeni]
MQSTWILSKPYVPDTILSVPLNLGGKINDYY